MILNIEDIFSRLEGTMAEKKQKIIETKYGRPKQINIPAVEKSFYDALQKAKQIAGVRSDGPMIKALAQEALISRGLLKI